MVSTPFHNPIIPYSIWEHPSISKPAPSPSTGIPGIAKIPLLLREE